MDHGRIGPALKMTCQPFSKKVSDILECHFVAGAVFGDVGGDVGGKPLLLCHVMRFHA